MSSKALAYFSALLSGICGNMAAFGFIPDPYIQLAGGLCAVLMSVGIVSASHSDSATPVRGAAVLGLVLVCMLPFGVACSTAQIAKEKQVALKIKTDVQTVIIEGCKDLPALEVAAGVIVPIVAPGSQAVLSLAETDAGAFCARAKALAAQPVSQ